MLPPNLTLDNPDRQMVPVWWANGWHRGFVATVNTTIACHILDMTYGINEPGQL